MAEKSLTNMNNGGRQAEADYSSLFRKFVATAVLSSVLPLLLIGWGLSIYYFRFAKAGMMANFEERVAQHKKAIELFLDNRMTELHLIAESYTLEHLNDKDNLTRILDRMNSISRQKYGKPFTDLGVIGDSGGHLAYAGPYDLMDKNYSGTAWFRNVMKQGEYVSDLFLGFRQAPHFIMAVSRSENGGRWILRATIDAEAFRSMVEDVQIGRTGEVFLVNREGVLQTQPKFGGKIMEKGMPAPQVHGGIIIETMTSESDPDQIAAHAWLSTASWMLVVRQDYSEAFNSVNHANYATLFLLHVSAIAIFLVSYFAMRHLIRIIRERDMERDHLNEQLVQTGKLASIGQLAAGVAHEVNNPLGIIMTERQILMDRVERTPDMDPDFRTQLNKSLEQIRVQINRCKHITLNLLRFSRRTVSRVEKLDLNEFLTEIIDLRARDAQTSGVKFLTDLSPAVAPILSDPSQLQQIFLNLITNAIDAHEEKGYGAIRIATAVAGGGEMVQVTVEDTGSGIRPEHLDQIFEPFFTTKPVGKGTGLGLSICFSIVKRLGGNISVKSEPGEGTAFTILLPMAPPPDLEKNGG